MLLLGLLLADDLRAHGVPLADAGARSSALAAALDAQQLALAVAILAHPDTDRHLRNTIFSFI